MGFTMQVIHDALHAADLPRGVIVTIGNYDGVHRGQRSVLDLVKARAHTTGLHSVVVTFDPHPLTVLHPEVSVRLLTTQAQKETLLDQAAVDYVLVVRFTPEFAKMPARTFVRDFLWGALEAREIYVGSRFAFGHRREGDLSLLRQMGETYGFSAFAVDEVSHLGEPISSTRIRHALADGDVALARELLGRPYAITGIITRGDRMGKRLGWPTINLAPENDLVPFDGVYASRVFFPSFPATFDAVTNIGTRPTVYENYQRVVESHILDFNADVYGETVELRFYKRLRDERTFPSMMDLSAQIGRDVESAREALATLQESETPTVAGEA
ncbi:MAG TPA: bifunctional riboflavin kinase/FAD synthetase [Thermoanaerobaculia bacterium]|nr:bifunctional riboflavin kinase/FAD synthetase [Thermoanaerobaculia bacterium]